VLIPSESIINIRLFPFCLLPQLDVCRFASALGQEFATQNINPSHALSSPNPAAVASDIRENPVPTITCASFACLPKRSRQRFLKMIHTFTKDLFIREKVWSKMNDYERVLLKLIAKEICMQPTLIRFFLNVFISLC
jgi:hypothetical protein